MHPPSATPVYALPHDVGRGGGGGSTLQGDCSGDLSGAPSGAVDLERGVARRGVSVRRRPGSAEARNWILECGVAPPPRARPGIAFFFGIEGTSRWLSGRQCGGRRGRRWKEDDGRRAQKGGEAPIDASSSTSKGRKMHRKRRESASRLCLLSERKQTKGNFCCHLLPPPGRRRRPLQWLRQLQAH